VALLGFKKTGRSLRKGSLVTLLSDTNDLYAPKAGDEAFIAKTDADFSWIVPRESLIANYEEFGAKVSNEILTRQRLQFICGRVTDQSANEAGEIAARQIVQIVNSWKNKSWPNTFGIRYPSDDRNDPYFRAFVLGDTMFKEQNFTKINEENFTDLLEDPEE
jgi:hypothetical protein